MDEIGAIRYQIIWSIFLLSLPQFTESFEPDPGSDPYPDIFWLDPDPQKSNTDPRHWQK